MDLGSLRTLVHDVNFGVQGVDATLTRPFPDEVPVSTRVIWLGPDTEDVPVGTAFQRRESRRVVAIRRTDVASVPRGSILEAPEYAGGPVQRWRVDGVHHTTPEHVRVTVVPDPEVP